MAQINLDIVTRTNLQGLNQLKAKLQDVSKSAQSAQGLMVGTYSAAEIQKTIRAVNTLERALTMAYDKKLNTVNVQKFNQYLAKSNLTIKDLYTHLSRLGAEGQQAFIKMSQTALTMGRSIKKTNKLVTEMKTTMVNTFKWGISSGLWNTMLSSVSKAFTYVKGLDKDLNNIRIVTGKSADQMERFAKTANKAAKDLAVSTRDYTQGALIYYQQGDDDKTVAKKTEVTAKAANVTGQDMHTVSEQLTAVWNGYQVANQAAKEGMQVYEEYVDKMAAVGAETAADLEELATAMSKVASAAHSMGVDFDQLNAQISTIVSVTRQAPESVGTALKTIYARLGDLKVDGVDEFGTKLGEVSSQLKTMGIDVVDSNGQMREMGTVMTEVASKWDGWTSSQKQAAAVAMAGKRQYNNLIALFDNWDMYSESLETSMGSVGTLTEQQGIAVESLDKKMQRLSTAGEKIYDALFDKESLGGFIDGLSTVVDLIGSAVEGVGGLSTLLPAVSGMLLKSFGGNIANSFAEKAENNRIREKEKQNDFAKRELAKQLGDKGNFLKANGEEDTLMTNEQGALVEYYKEMAKYREQMTDEEIAASNEIFKRRAELANEKIQTEEQLEILKKKNAISKEDYDLLIKKNKADKELTEDEERRIENIEQENIKRREMYEKIQTLAIEESDLPNYNDAEAARETVQNYRSEFNRHRNAISLNLGNNEQARQAAPTIQNMMTKAAREGVSEEDVVNQVREELEKIEGFEINDRILLKLKGTYKAMKEETEKFVAGLESDFESAIGQNLRASLGDEAGPIIDNLKEKVISLQKTGLTLQEAYVQAMEQIRQESEDTANTLASVEMQIADQAAIEEEMEAAKANQELKASIEGITTVVGGATQVYGGFMGVMNSFASAMDPTLDSTERLKAAFMGLITSGPILVNGLKSVVGGFKAFSEAGGLSTIVKNLFVKATQESAEALQAESNALDESSNEHDQHTEEVIQDGIAQRTAQNNNNNDQNFVEQLSNIPAMSTNEPQTHLSNISPIFQDNVDDATRSLNNLSGAASTAGASVTAAGGAASTAGASMTAAGGSTAALGLSLGALVAVATAAAVVIGAVVIGCYLYQESLEKEVEAAEEAYNTRKELAQAAKEEKEAIDAVVASYEDLAKQYEKSEISLDELQTKTADLLIQYEQQDLALKALISNYGDLNQLMDENQKIKTQDMIEKNEAAIKTGKTLMVSKIMAEGDSSITDETNGRASLDVVDGVFADGDEGKLQDFLAKYGIETVDGHIYTDEFVDALSKNYDEIVAGLSEIDGDAAAGLKDIINLVSEQLEETKGMRKDNESAEKQLIAEEYKGREFFSYEDFNKAIDSMTNEVKEYFKTEEEARAWSVGQLTTKGNQKNAFIYDILQKQQQKNPGKEITEDVIKELENLDTEEINFVQQYFDMKAVDETFTEFANRYSDFIDFLNKENQIAPTIEFVLDNTEIKELTEGQLDSLFSGGDFEEVMKVSRENFEKMDFESQRLLMIRYYNDYQKYLVENKDEIIKNAEETAKELSDMNVSFKGEDKKIFTKQGNADYLKEEYSKILDPLLEENKVSYDELANALEVYYQEGNTNNLSENVKKLINELTKNSEDMSLLHEFTNMSLEGEQAKIDYINNLSDEFSKRANQIAEEEGVSLDKIYDVIVQSREKGYNTLDEQGKNIFDKFGKQLINPKELKNLGKMISLNKDYNAALKANSEMIQKAKNAELDYAKAYEYSKKQYDIINTSIDNLQSSYSSLTSIVEDYNENGSLSLDGIQTLLSMSNDMLSCLELENGQMSINGEKVKEITLARLENAKAAIVEETQSGMLAIVYGEVAEGASTAAYQNYVLGQSTKASAEEAKKGADEWVKYFAAITGKDVNDIYNNSEALEFMENQRKKMLNLESTMENIKNNDFSTISGDSKKEEEKFFKDEFDRYWKLNKLIDITSHSIEKLADAQSYLFRDELQNNIAKTNELLETQVKNYEALYEEQKKEAEEVQGTLLKMGVNFDAEGGIENYEEAAQKALDYYNDVVKRHNKGQVSDKGMEKAEKNYEKFKENLERYNTLYYNEMVSTEDAIAEKSREILENNLKNFELEIEIKLDEEDFKRETKNFLTEINKDFKKSFEDIGAIVEQAKFNTLSYGESFSTVGEAIQKVEEEILKLHNGEDSDMFSSITEAQEKLKELTQDAMTHAQDMKAAYEDAWNAYLDGISQSQEKFDKIQNQYSRVNEELEYQRQLIELIYGPEAYGMMGDFYKRQQENSLSQIAALQTEKELWEAQLKETAEGSADRIAIEERLFEIQSNLNNSVTTYIQLLKNEYANTVSGILDNFETQLTGSSLDEVEEEWERLTAHSDEYFNNIEGLYHTQTLANKIQESINNTSSVKNQQKLQDLYNKEIGYLREKEKLTQFDLDVANARYEIALKEIALEEARENKDSMKLMRDSSGNWSYQYVANEEEVAKKAQELSDAMYKLYELSDSAYKKNLESLQQLNRDYLEKAQEIATSQVLSEDEKELKLKELREWYLDEYERKVGENETIRQTLSNATVGVLKGLYDQDQTNIEHMSDEEKKAIKLIGEEGIKSFQELEEKAALNINGIGDAINTVAIKDIPEMTSKSQELANVWGADDGASVKAQSLDALNQIISTSTDYQTKMDEVAATVKEDWSESGIKGAIDSTTQATKDAEQAIKDLCDNTTNKLSTYRGEIEEISSAWEAAKLQVQEYIKKFEYLYKLKAAFDSGSLSDITDILGKIGDMSGYEGIKNDVNNNPNKTKGGDGIHYVIYEDAERTKVKGKINSTQVTQHRLKNGGFQLEYKELDSDGKETGKILTGYSDAMTYTATDADQRIKDEKAGKYAFGTKIALYQDQGKTKKIGEYPSSWVISASYMGNNQGFIQIDNPYLNSEKISGFAYMKDAQTFDTGGYTGEWGPEGKTAILHEKELVLNKEDTKNLLSAIGQLRKISLSFIEEQYNNALAKTQLSNSNIYQNIEDMYKRNLASMTAEIANLNVRATYEAETKELEKAKNQIFNIQAEFPNANSVDEIREAILSLPGLASQQMGLNLL